MQKVLVCGATGFIGRNLVDRLARRADLEIHGTWFSQRPFDAPDVRWHEADLRRVEHVARVVPGFDIIIQAAATTSGARDIVERPYIHTTDNAVMNSLLLRAAYDAKVRHFLFFSCSVMYPSQSDAAEGRGLGRRPADRAALPRERMDQDLRREDVRVLCRARSDAAHRHSPFQYLWPARQIRSRAQPRFRRDRDEGDDRASACDQGLGQWRRSARSALCRRPR